MHRDLKPENILIESIVEEKISVKIVDFGTALYRATNEKIRGALGTAYYIAPEVLVSVYTEKCDVWSLGVIAYILLCGVPPFNGRTDEEILKAVLKGSFDFKSNPIWSSVSDEAKDLISKMLIKDPDKRISAKDAYAHPWMRKKTFKQVTEEQTAAFLSNISKLNVQ